jgi:hypothetical protein
MDSLRSERSTKRSPLQQAKTHERVATYSIFLIVGIVVALVAGTFVVARAESPDAQARILSATTPIAQFIVSLATLALVRHQVSVAVGDIEQAEQTEGRLLHLTAAMSVMLESTGRAGHPLDERPGSLDHQQNARST